MVITQAKKTSLRGWLSDVSNIPLQQSVADLGVAYKNFFDSLKGKRKGKKVGSRQPVPDGNAGMPPAVERFWVTEKSQNAELALAKPFSVDRGEYIKANTTCHSWVLEFDGASCARARASLSELPTRSLTVSV